MNAPKALDLQSCPKCGTQSAKLYDIDAGMRLVLMKVPDIGELPGRVCAICFNLFTDKVSYGVKLRLEQQAKEKNRHMVWKSRVNLVKHAREKMTQKSYPDAAVSYEKYIRVLEMSYELKPGQLNPNVFGKSSRSKELTVLATTYWDLMRIYDHMPQYRDRMALASRKLAEFLPYSPIYPDVVKRAQQFANSAKNPEIVRDFLRQSKLGGERCFIATAAYESPDHPVVLSLRQFRDHRLLPSRMGRCLIHVYYKTSPSVARFIERNPSLKPALRWVLGHIVR